MNIAFRFSHNPSAMPVSLTNVFLRSHMFGNTRRKSVCKQHCSCICGKSPSPPAPLDSSRPHTPVLIGLPGAGEGASTKGRVQITDGSSRNKLVPKQSAEPPQTHTSLNICWPAAALDTYPSKANVAILYCS